MAETKKRARGRMAGGGFKDLITQADRDRVALLAGYGIPQKQICLMIMNGIASDTLAKHFRTELDLGIAKANSDVAGTLYQKAMSGDTTALIWWTKARMKWTETQKHHVGGADDGPVKIDSTFKIEFVDAKRKD
jgi:hypothetical protein